MAQDHLNDLPPVNILLVDDHPANLLALEAVLEPLAHNLVCVNSGQEALKWLLGHDCALILLDVQMPVLNGFETAGLIKEREKSRHIPIIFVTAVSRDDDSVLQGYAAGAVDYIVKPFGADVLKAKVISLIALFQQVEAIKRQDAGQREANVQLAVSEALLGEFKSTLDATLDGVFMFDAHSLHFSYINTGGSGQLGYDPEEILTLTPFDILSEMDAVVLLEKLTALREGTLPSYTFQTQQRRKDGSEVPVEVFMQFVAPERGAGRFVAVARDISARKEAEAAFLQAQRLARATVDALPENIAVLDGQGVIIAVNVAWRACAETNGFIGAVAGVGDNYLTICETINTEASGAVVTGIRAVMAGDEAQFCLEYPSHTPHEKRWYVLRVTRFIGAGPLHVVVAHEDITERKLAEARLQASEASLAMAQQTAHLGSWEWEPAPGDEWSKTPVRWSDETFRILGYMPGEVESSYANFIRVVHPDDRSALEARSPQALQDRKPYSVDHRIIRPDGTERFVHWLAHFMYDPAGNLIKVSGTVQDITERKEAEAALLRLHDELEARVQRRTAQLAQTNADLQIQIAEREAAEAETRTRARQQGAVAELGRQALTDVDMDTLLSGATALVTDTLEVEGSAVLELLPDEAALLMRANTGLATDANPHRVPLGVGSQAGYALLSETPTIVTDLRTETRFEPSPMLLERGIISSITVIVPGYKRPFGTLGAHTVRPRQFTQDDVNFLQAMANVLAAAIERDHVETEIRQLNLQLKATNKQLSDENVERQMALGNLREVTAGLVQSKEEAESARESAEVANRAKSDFLSRMSHELRTPLNAILGFGQILEMRNADASPQQQDNIQQILRAGRHLLDLINEVLDIARIEAGHLSLSLEPVAVGRLVREALELVQPLAAARHIQLVDEVRTVRAEPLVLADQQRLKQVLLNFLSNAVKYNCDGGSVIVSCEPVGEQAITYEGIECVGRLRLQVRDTGPGLTPPDIARLFVPFERLGAANTQIEGTGIGLALCKPLVEAMNGQVGVESAIGQGSTFWLELPLVQRTLAQSSLAAADASAKTLPVPVVPGFDSPRTILYVEDNLANIHLIEIVLATLSSQFRLLPAMQGSIGLELAAQHHPDLILLDVDLPDIMGDVVLSRLKANPVTQAIPVVVLSADATPRMIQRLLDGGAVHYLTKPLDVEQFLSLVREILTSAKAPSSASSTEE